MNSLAVLISRNSTTFVSVFCTAHELLMHKRRERLLTLLIVSYWQKHWNCFTTGSLVRLETAYAWWSICTTSITFPPIALRVDINARAVTSATSAYSSVRDWPNAPVESPCPWLTECASRVTRRPRTAASILRRILVPFLWHGTRQRPGDTKNDSWICGPSRLNPGFENIDVGGPANTMLAAVMKEHGNYLVLGVVEVGRPLWPRRGRYHGKDLGLFYLMIFFQNGRMGIDRSIASVMGGPGTKESGPFPWFTTS